MKTGKDIEELIDSGVKIHKLDKLKQKISLIEGLVISDNEPKILISNYKFKQDALFDTLEQSSKFEHALYNPIFKGVILIDVADYSKGNSLYFAAILATFSKLINTLIKKLKDEDALLDQIIPTGDGCYLVFNEKLNNSFFKIVLIILHEMNELQNQILKKYSKDRHHINKLHLRISCTLNEIDYFYDVAGNRNCYGLALNEASRILKLGQNFIYQNYPEGNSLDSVFFDKTVLAQANSLDKKLQKNHKVKSIINYLGKVTDKHGLDREIWWMKYSWMDFPINL